MKTIYKYALPAVGAFTVEMPVGSKVLSVQIQHNTPQMWVLVESDAFKEKRRFCIYGTGHQISEEDLPMLRFIATFQTGQSDFVWHLFEHCDLVQVMGLL